MNNKTCEDCGKVFVTPSKLASHKSRNTPCIIRDVPPQDQANPLRCTICNRVYSKKSNMTKHYKICIAKQGNGQPIVADNQLALRNRVVALEIAKIQADIERLKIIANI